MAHAFTVGIPDYDGTTDPDDFVRAFRKAALMLRWDDAEMLKALPDYLKGFGKSSYNKIKAADKDTIDKALVQLATVCALSPTTHLANFLKRRQNTGESMMSFVCNLQSLLEKAMPEAQGEQQNAVLRAHLEMLLPHHLRCTSLRRGTS